MSDSGSGIVAEEVDTYAAFLPRYLLEQMAEAPSASDAPELQAVEGVFLFADFTGFTSLAERLTRAGGAGTEQLSEILNSSFEPLIDEVLAFGGDVLKFAGDAVLAMWSEPGLASARRAVACALAMQRAMQKSTDARMRLRVAIAGGEARIFHVGGVLGRWEYMVAGEPLDRVGRIGSLVEPGAVGIAPALAEALLAANAPLEISGRSDQVVTVSHLPNAPTTRDRQEDLPQGLEWQRLAAYIPAAVRHLLGTGERRFLGEIRSLSVVFLRLHNVHEDTPLDEAQRAMCALQEACYRYEGSINKLSVDDKGVSLLIATGLPPMVHEDDASRAVRIALDSRAVVGSMGMNCSIGVATGPVYCGVVGGLQRREYTIIGPAVNTAARLMTHARDTILCDAETQSRSSGEMVFDTAAPIRIKGLEEAVWVSRPVAPRRGPERNPEQSLALAGRSQELRMLDGALQALVDGQRPDRWLIEGEAGIGKSALLRRFAWAAGRRGVRVIQTIGEGLQGAALQPWQSILSGWLALDGLSSAEQQFKVRAVLEAQGVDEHASILNPLLPFDFPETHASMALTGAARAERIRELVFRVLRHSQTRAQLLLLDDLHSFDPASVDLLDALLPRLAPQVVIATWRSGATLPVSDIFEDARLSVLQPLGDADINVAVRVGLNVDEIPAEVARFIALRARGTPLFALEIARHLVAVGALVLEGRHAIPGRALGDELALPGTVEGVVAARINRLPVRAQQVLKVASVIGRGFSRGELLALQADPESWHDELLALETAQFVDARGPDAWQFATPLLWQVARGQMLSAQRRELHARYAAWLGDQPRVLPSRVAGHWWAAHRVDEAIEWTDRAVEAAWVRHDSGEIIELLEQALKRVAEREDRISRYIHARWLRRIGEACSTLDRPQEARDYLLRALELLGTPLEVQASISTAALLELVRSQSTVFVGKVTDAGRLEAAHVCHELSIVMFGLGDRAGLIQATIRGLGLARGTEGGESLLARIRSNIAYALGLLGHQRLSKRFTRLALEAMEQADDAETEAWVRLPLGALSTSDGDWAGARELLHAGRDVARRLNHFMRVCEYQTTLLMIEFLVGDPSRATASYLRLQNDSEERGSTQSALWGSFGLARAHARRGHFAELDVSLARISSVMQYKVRSVSGRRGDLFEWWGLQALLALGRRDPAAAEEAVRCAVESIDTASQTHFILPGFHVALAAHALVNAQPGSTSRVELADRSREMMRDYARFAAIGQPLVDYFDSDAAWRAGQIRRSAAQLERALEGAQQFGMAYEEVAMLETWVARFADGPELERRLQRHGQLIARFGLERLPFGLRLGPDGVT